jgi:hypothetical protein
VIYGLFRVVLESRPAPASPSKRHIVCSSSCRVSRLHRAKGGKLDDDAYIFAISSAILTVVIFALVKAA